MDVKITWQRQVTTQLQMPQLCAVTGEQATSLLPTLFRNRTAYWLPGIGRLIMNATNPTMMVRVPVCAAVRQRAMTWRMVSLFVPLAGIALGFVLAATVGDVAGSLLFFVLLLASIGVGIFGRFQADVFGTDVNGDALSMSKAHPAFVDAMTRFNAPGIVQVDGSSSPSYRPQQYGPQQYGTQQYGTSYSRPAPDASYDPLPEYRSPDPS